MILHIFGFGLVAMLPIEKIMVAEEQLLPLIDLPISENN